MYKEWPRSSGSEVMIDSVTTLFILIPNHCSSRYYGVVSLVVERRVFFFFARKCIPGYYTNKISARRNPVDDQSYPDWCQVHLCHAQQSARTYMIRCDEQHVVSCSYVFSSSICMVRGRRYFIDTGQGCCRHRVYRAFVRCICTSGAQKDRS